MLLGYNTNGFGFHRLDDALEIIAGLGYSCAAITLDVHHLNPFTATDADVARVRARLEALGLACVIETGSRFLLDPWRKHRPTLIDFDARLRRQFLSRAINIAAALGAHCVSHWSGARPEGFDGDDSELFKRLAGHVDELDDEAREAGVVMALEPEPGFLVERMSDVDRLAVLLGRTPALTLDIGHIVCVESDSVGDVLARWMPHTVNIQLDDMKRGVHEHLRFGRGDVDFAAAFRALRDGGFTAPACVELSDGSRNAVEVARESFAFLKRYA
jgi:L-ribulose-5-phosphate 3-epimerase